MPHSSSEASVFFLKKKIITDAASHHLNACFVFIFCIQFVLMRWEGIPKKKAMLHRAQRH